MSSRRSDPLPGLRGLLRWGLILSLIALAGTAQHRTALPPLSEILPALQRSPQQIMTKARMFKFTYSGKNYLVEPLATYELWGLVVSHNNIHSLADMYHDSSSVDFKDLCVVWGENLKSTVYQKLKYSSAPWTCYFHADSRADYQQFRQDQISNNHLLADDRAVREVINTATIGDQVHLRGWLVNYTPASNVSLMRKSSLVRTDTGNGACEVMYVEEAQVLKPANSGWRAAYDWAVKTAVWCAVLWPLTAICAIGLANRRLYGKKRRVKTY